MGIHAILGPSAAHRWLVCTPSARFEEQIPHEESPYAAEGTLAHELAALLLSARTGSFYAGDGDYGAQLRQLQGDEHYSAEMLEHVEAYADFVAGIGGEILIEHKYDLSEYVPLGFGTSDATNYTPGILTITDLKYGAGVPVSAKHNKQGMLYALGALIHFRARGKAVTMVVINIYQPRSIGVSSWEISADELIKWAESEVLPKATLAIGGQGEFVPGEHCQFCRARTKCAAYYDMFEDIEDISDKRVMTAEQLARVLKYGDAVTTWIKKVKEDAVRTLERNGTIPGFKLVAGRGKRTFKNEDNVVDILIGEGVEDMFNVSLKPLTELEKLLGRKRFDALFGNEILKVEGAPQLAEVNDPRQPIGRSRADDFDDYEDLT